ncbi:MAG: hypothetical protein O7D35_00210, partial [Acidobacteria bacterium]|nr:hypothetical protein [Acidobacteriota bacterium]
MKFMLWTLAIRSVIARRRRTVFVMLSLALSSFVLVVGSSVLTSFKTNIEAGLRHGLIGDLQIYHAANTPP